MRLQSWNGSELASHRSLSLCQSTRRQRYFVPFDERVLRANAEHRHDGNLTPKRDYKDASLRRTARLDVFEGPPRMSPRCSPKRAVAKPTQSFPALAAACG